MDSAPCGCRFGTDVIDGVATFLYEPCAEDCELYLWVLEEGQRVHGRPPTVIDTR